MSIAPPRYAVPNIARVAREQRALTIFFNEVTARAGWGTGLVVAFGYAVTLIAILLTVLLRPPGGAPLSAFYVPIGLATWPLLILLVSATTGSGAIAEDLTSRSITLYLSRPIHLIDYLGAKTAAVAFWIGMVAVGPCLVGVLLAAGLGAVSATVAFSAFGAYIVVGFLATFFFTGLAIALSTWTARSLYAGVALFGVVLALQLAAVVISGITGDAQIRYLGVFTDLQNVGVSAFQTGGEQSVDPALSAVALILVGLGLFVAAWQRLIRVEVVGE
ncbi:MAG: ABC transporter permease [Thermoplasmata archaeon]|nr:ABC transporter permease [Thermoplasmata archaeon]MCI4354807.1 ABC transporter permease [Thermoplasmata archaeon]